jgi:hypothetical protein
MNEIRAAQEELNRVFSEAGQSFYAQSQSAGASAEAGATADATGQPTSGGPTPGATPHDDAVEADYEIVDESKK